MKLESKYLFLFALLILFISGISILFSHNGFALSLIDFVFWLLVVASILYIYQARNKHET